MDVNKWICFKYSGETSYIQNTRYEHTRSHQSGGESQCGFEMLHEIWLAQEKPIKYHVTLIFHIWRHYRLTSRASTARLMEFINFLHRFSSSSFSCWHLASCSFSCSKSIPHHQSSILSTYKNFLTKATCIASGDSIRSLRTTGSTSLYVGHWPENIRKYAWILFLRWFIHRSTVAFFMSTIYTVLKS